MTRNSINLTSSGIASYNGAGVFSAITPTNHAIQIGSSAAASLTQLVGTSNTVIQGNTGADPTFTATPSVTSITLSNLPVSPTDGVNKAYADLISAGFTVKAACNASSPTNLTATYLNGASGVGATLTNSGTLAALTVDGYAVNNGDRILVYSQTSTFQNGIYQQTVAGSGVTAWILTRTTDYDTAAEILPGTLVPVINGTLNAKTIWLETATVTTVGTDPVLFSSFVFGPGNFLTIANNLSDVANAATSRTNLGLTAVAIATTTQFNVLLGNTGNTITNIAPSATAGIPLVSQGSAANPAFSTASVAGGGTGTTGFATNGVVISGTVSTNPLTALNLINGQIVIGRTALSPVAANLTAGSGIAITNGSGTITISGGPVTWINQSGVFTAVVNRGYFIIGGATATLPTASNGDQISFITQTSSSLVINAPALNFISIGSSTSGSSGNIQCAVLGNAITLVYRAASLTWESTGAPQGGWVVN